MNNVSSEEDLEPLSADISKFWLFKCDFCLNLAAAKNEIVCEDSRECTEVSIDYKQKAIFFLFFGVDKLNSLKRTIKSVCNLFLRFLVYVTHFIINAV